MYEYNLLLSHNCGYLYSEERTTGGFLRMATNKPSCVIIWIKTQRETTHREKVEFLAKRLSR